MHIFLKFSYQFSYNFERSDPKRVWQNRLNVELSTRMNIKSRIKISPLAGSWGGRFAQNYRKI